jgi:hypothetical protein
MKKIVLGSILLAAIFVGCGGDSSCCDVSKTQAPTLTESGVKEPAPQEPAPQTVNPTAIISLSDSEGPLAVHTNHTFSCADSHDNDTLGSGKEIVSCEWSIQSYRVDENGALVPYRNCTEEVMDNKPIYICDKVVKIVATLKVTDNDGETDVTTTEYLDFEK